MVRRVLLHFGIVLESRSTEQIIPDLKIAKISTAPLPGLHLENRANVFTEFFASGSEVTERVQEVVFMITLKDMFVKPDVKVHHPFLKRIQSPY